MTGPTYDPRQGFRPVRPVRPPSFGDLVTDPFGWPTIRVRRTFHPAEVVLVCIAWVMQCAVGVVSLTIPLLFEMNCALSNTSAANDCESTAVLWNLVLVGLIVSAVALAAASPVGAWYAARRGWSPCMPALACLVLQLAVYPLTLLFSAIA